jgi:transposase
MIPLPDLSKLDHAAKDALILELFALVSKLTERVAELEAKLSRPPKTPDNSSTPPSMSPKGGVTTSGRSVGGKKRRKGRKGAFRALHPAPDRIRDLRLASCPCCARDVWQVRQRLCQAYDHIDIPPITPVVTRLNLFEGRCPTCDKVFKAAPPEDMPPGSPFGPGLRALVLYLRYTQGIGLERLSHLLVECFGVSISQGALNNMLDKAADCFAEQFKRIRERLLSASVLASDETSLRIAASNGWLWVAHHGDSAAFMADASRAKRVLEDFLGDHRPSFWLSDRYGGQRGFASKAHQYCLAHLIRDSQYAIDAGDDVFAPGLLNLLKRACRIGRERSKLSDGQLRAYHKRYAQRLRRLFRLQPTHPEGIALRKAIAKARKNLFVFLKSRDLDPTNNGSERSLRPCVTFRKITNGFRTARGADLYANIRSVLETARRRAIPSLEAIRLTLAGIPLPITIP